MSPAEKAAQAKRDARVAQAARLFLDSIKTKSGRRADDVGNQVVKLEVHADFDDLTIAVKASGSARRGDGRGRRVVSYEGRCEARVCYHAELDDIEPTTDIPRGVSAEQFIAVAQVEATKLVARAVLHLAEVLDARPDFSRDVLITSKHATPAQIQAALDALRKPTPDGAA